MRNHFCMGYGRPKAKNPNRPAFPSSLLISHLNLGSSRSGGAEGPVIQECDNLSRTMMFVPVLAGSQVKRDMFFRVGKI